MELFLVSWSPPKKKSVSFFSHTEVSLPSPGKPSQVSSIPCILLKVWWMLSVSRVPHGYVSSWFNKLQIKRKLLHHPPPLQGNPQAESGRTGGHSRLWSVSILKSCWAAFMKILQLGNGDVSELNPTLLFGRTLRVLYSPQIFALFFGSSLFVH